jgi:hypothetical protein
LYPVPDGTVVRDNGASLLSKFMQPPQFPSSLDAVKDFDDAVMHVIEHIGLEYGRFATETEKSSEPKSNNQGGMTAKGVTA